MLKRTSRRESQLEGAQCTDGETEGKERQGPDKVRKLVCVLDGKWPGPRPVPRAALGCHSARHDSLGVVTGKGGTDGRLAGLLATGNCLETEGRYFSHTEPDSHSKRVQAFVSRKRCSLGHPSG